MLVSGTHPKLRGREEEIYTIGFKESICMIQDSLSVLCWIGPTYERRLGSSSGMEGKRKEKESEKH